MRTSSERGVYVISVAADLAGVHPQTLRAYETKGLLAPVRTPGGSRRYSQRDLERLRRIAELTAEGLNLAGVKKVLALEDERRQLREELARLRREAQRRTEAQPRRDVIPVAAAVTPFTKRTR